MIVSCKLGLPVKLHADRVAPSQDYFVNPHIDVLNKGCVSPSVQYSGKLFLKNVFNCIETKFRVQFSIALNLLSCSNSKLV